jgi:hypothetical protein
MHSSPQSVLGRSQQAPIISPKTRFFGLTQFFNNQVQPEG